jgi:hypothetical protein
VPPPLSLYHSISLPPFLSLSLSLSLSLTYFFSLSLSLPLSHSLSFLSLPLYPPSQSITILVTFSDVFLMPISGQLLRVWPPHHLRLPDACGLCPSLLCHRDPSRGRSRRRLCRRQDQYGRVRDGVRMRRLNLWADKERLEVGGGQILPAGKSHDQPRTIPCDSADDSSTICTICMQLQPVCLHISANINGKLNWTPLSANCSMKSYEKSYI